MKKSKNNKGITLIALVITIIVLLILAGICISTLTGENGVLTKASTAKEQTEIEEAKEQAKLDIATWVADKLEKQEDADLNDSIIQEILTKKDYVKSEEGQPGTNSFKTAKSGYEIPYTDLYTRKEIEFTLSWVKLTAYMGETWDEWADRNQELIKNIFENDFHVQYILLKGEYRDMVSFPAYISGRFGGCIFRVGRSGKGYISPFNGGKLF